MNRNKKCVLIILTLLTALSAIVFSGCKSDEPKEDGILKSFTLTVVDGEGNESVFSLSSKMIYLGDALSEEGIIVGEEGPYGIFIKEVNGISAVFEETGTYWAFYIDGEYAMTGIDKTKIVDGESYTLKVEK